MRKARADNAVVVVSIPEITNSAPSAFGDWVGEVPGIERVESISITGTFADDSLLSKATAVTEIIAQADSDAPWIWVSQPIQYRGVVGDGRDGRCEYATAGLPRRFMYGRHGERLWLRDKEN
jgi:hypothetical protein